MTTIQVWMTESSSELFLAMKPRLLPSTIAFLLAMQIGLSCFLFCFGNNFAEFRQAIQASNENRRQLVSDHCFDYREECFILAKKGECQTNSRWMHSHCPVSCKKCDRIIQEVPIQTKFGEITIRSFSVIRDAYGSDLGAPQTISSSAPQTISSRRKAYDEEYLDNVIDSIEKARLYITDEVNTEERYRMVRSKCRNYNESCAELAYNGECENDAEFMSQYCGPMCQSCDLLHLQSKCPLPHPNDVQNAWYPGDLNRMFERITIDKALSKKCNVTILSRPEISSNNSSLESDSGPWVVLIDNFLNASEANRLIELGANAGYYRSTDSGEVLEDGSLNLVENDDRTSTNAWCNTDECMNDPITIDLYDRIENLVQIPKTFSEEFQLLRYEKGQFYHEHHDYIVDEYDRIQGVRMLTVFLYLNDVAGGGETKFPNLNLSVTPVLGRALIWPSVYNSRPHIMDPRTMHEALPVTGDNEIKYGANVWIHQREIIDGCV